MKQLSHENPLVGTIACTTGEVLGHMDFSWYLEAMRRAGREVVDQGAISVETAAVLAKNLIPLEAFLSIANASWNVPGDIAPTLEEALRGDAKNI